ncbi:MAG: XdhC/CoxI family protein [Ignavibacteriaceae bacterium]|nr:XdhC/CoxI family protein [Ignavibacteriaceae bacterium]
MFELFRKLSERIKENRPTILITITRTRGATPGKTGFKILVGEEGRVTGTIGGGAVEFHAIDKCKELIKSNTAYYNEIIQLVDNDKGQGEKINLKKEQETNSPGTTKIVLPAWCGGEVELFYEIYKAQNVLYIFGAGHVGAAVSDLAVRHGFYVEIFDNRKEILDALPEKSYSQKHLIEYPPAQFTHTLDDKGYVFIVTQSHRYDLPVLEYLLNNYPSFKYIGMIGSKLKVKECVSFLKEKYGKEISLDNLYAPVGIDIGGDTPVDISLAVLAELFAVINDKQVTHLRLNYAEIGK